MACWVGGAVRQRGKTKRGEREHNASNEGAAGPLKEKEAALRHLPEHTGKEAEHQHQQSSSTKVAALRGPTSPGMRKGEAEWAGVGAAGVAGADAGAGGGAGAGAAAAAAAPAAGADAGASSPFSLPEAWGDTLGDSLGERPGEGRDGGGAMLG